jgi:hypothetical protein
VWRGELCDRCAGRLHPSRRWLPTRLLGAAPRVVEDVDGVAGCSRVDEYECLSVATVLLL